MEPTQEAIRRQPVTARALRRSVAAVVTSAALIAACSGSETSANGGATDDNGGDYTYIYTRNVPQPSPFDGPIVKGYEAAGDDLGVETIFKGAPPDSTASNPAEWQRLMENAISQNPDCLITTFDTPSTQGPLVEQAVAAGIPVVFANAGYEQAEEHGALTYIGSDERLQGEIGASMLAELGVEHPLVVTLSPGSMPLTDLRNEGFEDSFEGEVEWLHISLEQATGNVTSVIGAIEAKLAGDASIDAVFSIGVVFAPPVLAVYDNIGQRAADLIWATVDTNDQIIDAVEDETFAFALDQQQYLQGYWAALVCDQYVRYGLKPASYVMATGPLVVNTDNIADYRRAADAGVH